MTDSVAVEAAAMIEDQTSDSMSKSDMSVVVAGSISRAGGGPKPSSVEIAEMSSWRASTSGLMGPLGCRDVQSGARCLLPGMWCILKR